MDGGAFTASSAQVGYSTALSLQMWSGADRRDQDVEGGWFIPVALVLISPAHLGLCVSQVTGGSWRAGLSARSSSSWWLCSASTSECSTVDDFTSCRETLSFFVLVNTNKDSGNLSPVFTNSSLVGNKRLLTHHRKKKHSGGVIYQL